MPSSLQSLAESSLKEKRNHKKQKQGESVYVVDPVHREKLLAAQGHVVTSPKAHLPHSREAPPHRVSGSPRHPRTKTQANLMPHSPGKPAGLPEPGPSWPPVWLLPRQPSPPRCAHFLVFLSAAVGAQKLAHSGASFRHTLTPTVGQILNLPVQVQSSCSVSEDKNHV